VTSLRNGTRPRALMAAMMALAATVSCAAFAQEGSVPYFDQLGAPSGIGKYSRQDWGIVGVELVNPSNEPADLLATTYFQGDPSLQFGRELWVPPRARRRSWYPVLPPENITFQQRTVEVKSLLLGGSENIVLKRSDDRMLHSEQLRIDLDRSVTGLMSSGHHLDGQGDDLAMATTVAVRLSDGLTRAVSELRYSTLSPVAEGWQALDHLVMANDRIADDISALRALRRWVQNGGRLWIMLDQVDPSTVEMLLGGTIDFEIVDQTELNEVAIDAGPAAKTSWDVESREFDQPARFVRVIATSVDVTHTVNGWPAAFWKSMGRGQVLVTTLAAEAWIRRRTSGDPQPNVAKYIGDQPLDQLATRFFEREDESRFDEGQLEPVLAEQIGYQIVSRGPVSAILGVFCGSLLIGAIWLGRKGKLEYLGVVGPVLALATTAALAGMGLNATQSVPSTTAVVQLVDVVEGAEDVKMAGMTALYHQRETTQPIGVLQGGLFRPDMSGLAGETRRMIWTDMDAWHWQDLTLPSGVRAVPFEYATDTDLPIWARGTFGPNGFYGRVDTGPFSNPGDAIVMNTAMGGASAIIESDGSFVSRPADRLAPGQFLSGGLVDDTQRRRLQMYKTLFSQDILESQYENPTLLVWADDIDMRFSFPDVERHVGSALLRIPLSIDRPDAGSDVRVSTTFLKCADVIGPQSRRGGLNTYDSRRGKWGDKRNASLTWLRFQLPEQLLPIELSRATFTVDINAPSRKMEVLGVSGEDAVLIATDNSPIGSFAYEIDDTEVLKLDSYGGLLLGIDLGESTRPTGANSENTWNVNSVQLQLYGKTLQ